MEIKKNSTVVVGLSGGVDSSVSALLLKEQGYNVIGLFMRNWNDASVTLEDECPWVEDSNDALLIANALGIPFQVVDLSDTYKERIVDYMFDEYQKGRTPNPDVLCNREIKFDVFLDIALSLGADYVATGHYVQKSESIINEEKIYHLLAGKDKNKDQSYFLCQLNQYQLSKALFPIGHLEKSEVRKIAKENNLITAEKKDSQGLCFIGKVSLPEFLQQKLKSQKGKIVEIFSDFAPYHKEKPSFDSLEDELAYESENYQYEEWNGKVVGEHIGAHFFTKGQRKGLGVGGHKEPLFVIETDVEKNIVYVGEGSSHHGLFKHTLHINEQDAHFIREDLEMKIGESIEVMSRIRYRQELKKSTLYRTKSGYYLRFEQPISAITEGQFAACYIENELFFSGVIS
ncbi:MAG: tRNA 2-thiouridine(34) synthase MnmA [Flavobacteriales bacterium]|nr:tRNA 2-thiouridine(34) synthase MnmA [Flavobacteriales bacterium]